MFLTKVDDFFDDENDNFDSQEEQRLLKPENSQSVRILILSNNILKKNTKPFYLTGFRSHSSSRQIWL